jgi:hypothetical protein
VQTVIAPHEPDVRNQLDALPPRLREIAHRYIERLRWSRSSATGWSAGCSPARTAGRCTSTATAAPTTCSAAGGRPAAVATRTRPRGLSGESCTGCWRPRAPTCASCRYWRSVRADVEPGDEDVYAAATRLLGRLDWRTR